MFIVQHEFLNSHWNKTMIFHKSQWKWRAKKVPPWYKHVANAKFSTRQKSQWTWTLMKTLGRFPGRSVVSVWCCLFFIWFVFVSFLLIYIIVLLFPPFLKNMSILFQDGYKNKSRLNSGLKPARFLGFQSFSNFSPVFPSKSTFFAANLFLFEYVLFFIWLLFFVCLFLPSVLLDLHFFQIKNKTRLNRRLNSELKSACFLVSVFQHFFQFFSQNQHCAVFFLFF